MVTACAQAFDYVGLPEGRFHLARRPCIWPPRPRATPPLPSSMPWRRCEREQETEMPAHLRDANRDKEGFGHGEGYLYPHAYRDHWVAQQYLPGSLQGRVFYQPSDQGYERDIQDEVSRRREAQLAAMLEGGEGFGAEEVLTFTGAGRGAGPRSLAAARGRRRRRAAGCAPRPGARRGHLQRHHLVLDLNAGTGLLTWEAARQDAGRQRLGAGGERSRSGCPARNGSALPEIERPAVLQGNPFELPALLAARGDEQVRFRCDRGAQRPGRASSAAGRGKRPGPTWPLC